MYMLDIVDGGVHFVHKMVINLVQRLLEQKLILVGQKFQENLVSCSISQCVYFDVAAIAQSSCVCCF